MEKHKIENCKNEKHKNKVNGPKCLTFFFVIWFKDMFENFEKYFFINDLNFTFFYFLYLIKSHKWQFKNKYSFSCK